MEHRNRHKLDHPAWHSLTETHAAFALSYEGLKCYDPAFCPFGACVYPGDSVQSLEQYAARAGNFFIIGERPVFGNWLVLKNELKCLQMLAGATLQTTIDNQIIPLTNSHERELSGLVNLVQPGYFREKTRQLGDYFGIFDSGKLVAVAGERMRMELFTEVSAVVTHPGHTGKGYASRLVAHMVNKIFSEGKTPYLHVAATNSDAIRLYEKAGFVLRRKISFWNLITPPI